MLNDRWMAALEPLLAAHEPAMIATMERAYGYMTEGPAGTAGPRDQLHVVIFYTAGELARRVLGKTGDEHDQPYAYRYGAYTRGWQTPRDTAR